MANRRQAVLRRMRPETDPYLKALEHWGERPKKPKPPKPPALPFGALQLAKKAAKSQAPKQPKLESPIFEIEIPGHRVYAARGRPRKQRVV